mmetsp:Transcript_19641/g.69542  ORF Transcript_19641/g.69542 Transcript_19641/m.69542 type:complete len:241 (+) Transcript_19641:100-822(+)
MAAGSQNGSASAGGVGGRQAKTGKARGPDTGTRGTKWSCARRAHASTIGRRRAPAALTGADAAADAVAAARGEGRDADEATAAVEASDAADAVESVDPSDGVGGIAAAASFSASRAASRRPATRSAVMGSPAGGAGSSYTSSPSCLTTRKPSARSSPCAAGMLHSGAPHSLTTFGCRVANRRVWLGLQDAPAGSRTRAATFLRYSRSTLAILAKLPALLARSCCTQCDCSVSKDFRFVTS